MIPNKLPRAFLCFALLLAATLGEKSFAAPAEADFSVGGGSGSSYTVTGNSSAAVGDLLVIDIQLIQDPDYPSTPTAANVVCNDTQNSGNYTSVGAVRWDATNAIFVAAYYMVNQVAGTPHITCTPTVTGAYGGANYTRFNGWTGIATLDSALTLSGGGSSTSVSLTPITNNFANEITFVSIKAPGSAGSPAGWTALQVGYEYYAVQTAAYTANPFTETIGSAPWNALAFGFYDAPVAPTNSLPLSNLIANQNGTFTLTATGTSSALTFVCKYTAVNSAVDVSCPPGIATSNATTFTVSGFPVVLEPATQTQLVPIAACEDNTATTSTCEIEIPAASTTWTFLKGVNASGWTSSGSKGFPTGFNENWHFSLQ